MSDRPLTAKEVRKMFEALDKAEADKLARRIEQEQRSEAKVAQWKPYEE